MLDFFLNKKKVECPRCLGKGMVDWEDIKRLNKELKWEPGTCAYCKGEGTVNKALLEKLAPDITYLTTNISDAERDRLIRNDSGAHQRARHLEMSIDNFAKEVEYLYFIGEMDAEKITEFYFLHQSPSEINFDEKEEFLQYVNQIIDLKNIDLV